MSDVRNEVVAQGTPVRLRGVVTFFDERLYSRFIQDSTAGIYLQFPTNATPPSLISGQIVEVQGTVNPGEYAPVVMVDTVSVLGQASLPEPKRVTYEELASGAEDSQFVAIEGIVHTWEELPTGGYYRVDIATGGGRVTVFVPRAAVPHPESLPDCQVLVRGVGSTKFNHQRQLFALRLMVPRPEDFIVEKSTQADPYAIPVHPIASLLRFTPRDTYGHRVRVAGTVVYYQPGERLFLQDSNHGVEVQTPELVPLQLGDRAEALGFARQGDYTPLLQDAVFRRTGSGPPLAPADLSLDEVLKGDHDSQLIRVTARLLERALQGPAQRLVLQTSNLVFEATLNQGTNEAAQPQIANGSVVAVTGVCRIDPGDWEPGANWRAKSFSVLLRSPDDIQLLEAPPWWTLRKVLWILGLLGFVLLAAFAWVGVLQRQVTERTRELAEQIQQRELADRRREIEQERARLAQDLHDDLGSRLTEVNMLSTLVRSHTTSPEEKERYLREMTETARHMVTSLDEIVWAVSPRNDTTASLASYFGAYAQRLLDIASIACGLEIAEDLPLHPLDPKFRQELFYAFKEALTNVVRHAVATRVCLRMSVTDGLLIVEVADNGHGFRPGPHPAGEDGLKNMNDRLQSLGGRCEIVTEPGQGTTVRFRAPLPRRLL